MILSAHKDTGSEEHADMLQYYNYNLLFYTEFCNDMINLDFTIIKLHKYTLKKAPQFLKIDLFIKP